MNTAQLQLDRPHVHRHLPPAPRRGRDESSFDVRWARSEREVAEAQRLRYQVFAQEMGARLTPMLGMPPMHDVDRFDEHCEHLIVRAQLPGTGDRCAVGTCRVLTPAGALRAGGLYSDDEFDLTPIDALRPLMLELGRSCVDPAYRQGTVVMLLWSSIVAFMQRNGLRWAIGCASVPMRDGGHAAASLWRGLCETHLAAPEWRVTPRRPLPVEQLRQDLKVEAPPLIKGYLRCGAQLLGAPAWDAEFGTADLPLLIDVKAMSDRYQRRFTD
ncbi:MAG: GNAT family N-acetyltransferase [Burkholderiaceae bacterium]|nr:GNAT family N-acetyltransferase [Burkholderiaceae bacterium]